MPDLEVLYLPNAVLWGGDTAYKGRIHTAWPVGLRIPPFSVPARWAQDPVVSIGGL